MNSLYKWKLRASFQSCFGIHSSILFQLINSCMFCFNVMIVINLDFVVIIEYGPSVTLFLKTLWQWFLGCNWRHGSKNDHMGFRALLSPKHLWARGLLESSFVQATCLYIRNWINSLCSYTFIWNCEFSLCLMKGIFPLWPVWSDMYDMARHIVSGNWIYGWNCEIMGLSVWWMCQNIQRALWWHSIAFFVS